MQTARFLLNSLIIYEILTAWYPTAKEELPITLQLEVALFDFLAKKYNDRLSIRALRNSVVIVIYLIAVLLSQADFRERHWVIGHLQGQSRVGIEDVHRIDVGWQIGVIVEGVEIVNWLGKHSHDNASETASDTKSNCNIPRVNRLCVTLGVS